MATRKTVKSIYLNGQPLTPSGDASIPLLNGSYEGMDNLDGTTDAKFNPSKEAATLPVVLDEVSRAHISNTAKLTGWSCTVEFRDGSAMQISKAFIEGVPALDGDGSVELSVKGQVRWGL